MNDIRPAPADDTGEAAVAATLTAPARPEAPGLLGARVDYDARSPIRLAGPAPHTFSHHRQLWGRLPSAVGADLDRLLHTLEAIGLAGRGGGHFGVARKWRTALAAGGGGTVVANGAEGEPASAKDAALLQHRTHLVLDGLACAAEAIGADHTVLWLHAGATASLQAVERALAERKAAGRREPAVDVVLGPDSYLTGESSAIVRALSGGPALPAFRRVSAARSGIGGLPTLVHNVETLARVGVAARSGADGYHDSTLVTVVTGGLRTVLERDPSTTIAEAVATARTDRGSIPNGDPLPQGEPQAVLLGGYGGSWLPWADAAGLPLEHGALRRAGAGLGAGIVIPLPADTCGLAETAAAVDYLARSSARQCGPCLFGLRDVADLVGALARGVAGRAQVRLLHRFAGEIDGRGGCHHPDGAVRLVRTALTTFADDVDHHVGRGRCLHAGTPPVLPIPRPRTPDHA